MSLIYTNYFIAAIIFAFSYYIDMKMSNTKRIASFCSSVVIVLLLLAMSTSFAVSGNLRLSTFVFKFFVASTVFSMLQLLQLSFLYQKNVTSSVFTVFTFLALAASVIFSFATVHEFSYEPGVGFLISLKPVAIGNLNPFYVLAAFVLIFCPVFSCIVLFIRSFTLRSSVFRFQLRLMAGSLLLSLFFTYEILMYVVNHESFFWLQPLSLGFFYLLFTFCLVQISQVSVLPGTWILFGRAVSSIIAVAVIGGLFSLCVTLFSRTYLFTTSVVLYLVIVTVLFALSMRIMLSVRAMLIRLLRVRTEYQNDLENEFASIDYATGSDVVMTQVSGALKKYVDASSIDIIVEGDDGKLVPRYSTRERGLKFTENQVIGDFLLNKNIQVMIYSQVRSSVIYAECRKELLELFASLDADVIIVLQESHRIIGLFILGKKIAGSGYTEYDFNTFRNLHSYFFLVVYYLKNIANESVVTTVDRELQYSGQVINAIQGNMDRIDNPKVDISYISRSARNLGGDFIDFVRLSPDRHLFIMGDVSGKGLNASMSMVILKSVIRTFLQETTDFKDLVCKVNGFIKRNLPKGTFFAGVFGMFDFSQNILYYINCGIPDMLLYTDVYNNAVEIQGDGRILGFAKDVSKMLKVRKIILNPNDILLMATDGIIDSQSLRGEPFGKNRIQKYLLDNKTYPADRITQFLVENFETFISRELSDDITVLVIKYQEK